MGDLIAPNGFSLELSFLDGFTLQDGDSFQFLTVGRLTNLDVAMIDVIANGSPGLGFDFEFNNGGFSLMAFVMDGPVNEIPVPGAAPLLLTGLAGLTFLRRRRERKAADA